MVRECRPLERELSSLKLARRSTMRTPVPASVSSAASIIPVGPPPAITTACSDIHSSFPNVCQETLHHTRGLAASPGGGTILRWREWGFLSPPDLSLGRGLRDLPAGAPLHGPLPRGAVGNQGSGRGAWCGLERAPPRRPERG